MREVGAPAVGPSVEVLCLEVSFASWAAHEEESAGRDAVQDCALLGFGVAPWRVAERFGPKVLNDLVAVGVLAVSHPPPRWTVNATNGVRKYV